MEDQAKYGKEEKAQTFLGYSYTDKILVDGFDPYKYANIMKIENPYFVYDKKGFLLSMICAPTKKEVIWECKKYILMKKLNLVPLIHRFNNLFKSLKK